MSMISSRKELQFYLMADRMMNRGAFKPTVKTVVSDCISPDYIMRWMKAMRVTSYYSNCQSGGVNCCIIGGCGALRNCR